MKKFDLYPINGAIVLSECKFDKKEGTLTFSEVNYDYKFGLESDGAVYASKDGKKFVIAVMLCKAV